MIESDDSRNGRSLSRLLLLLGLIDLLALLATIMPLDWMAWIHLLVGLGSLPEGRIVGYLARTTSALYAFHGALLVFISQDVDRYRPLIRFLCWGAIVHGCVLLGIDLVQKMPWYWTFAEAPGFAVTGIVMLWFLRTGAKQNAGLTHDDLEMSIASETEKDSSKRNEFA